MEDLLSIEEAINTDPPQVWLNGFFGFDPENWGCVTFTYRSRLERVREESRPGFLTVAYGVKSGETPAYMKGKILGVYRCSHETGKTDHFLSRYGLQRKLDMRYSEKSWDHAFRIVEAWQTVPERAPAVSDFAHITYSSSNGRNISRDSRRLAGEEARKIFDLDLCRVKVRGGDNDFDPVIIKGRDILTASKAGPVSQKPYTSREAEGPKHLYMLILEGPLDDLFDEPLGGKSVVKVGFSHSPLMRCDHFNKALPACKLKWHVLRSTYEDGDAPFPDSFTARVGEDAMKQTLAANLGSLGGEFFVASKKQIKSAWENAKRAAWNSDLPQLNKPVA